MRVTSRALLTLGTTVAVVVLCGGLAHAKVETPPTTAFEMPFPCAQAWTGTTRPSHSPSPKSVDWNRTDDVDDPVVASAPGVVSVADPRGTTGYGHWVRIDHTDGEQTIYAHLNDVYVQAGQSVDQGTLLGTVGMTGNATGPHLHFEERSAGSVVWPYFHATAFDFGSTLVSQNCVDVPLAGNFIGDAPAEVAVYRRAAPATFEINRLSGTTKVVRFGTATDQPVAGDWDGDGRFNPGVRTPADRTFQLRTPTGLVSIVFGGVKDLAVAGDWDGDGLWEVGVRKAGKPVWRLRAADGTVTKVIFGSAGEVPVTGDWDGDGRTDLGTYDSATATFTLRIVDTDGLVWTAQVPFGQPGDLPVTGDWDGNGKTDVGVWSPATATFSERRSPAPTASRSHTDERAFGNPR
jgi:hypothetical protein